MAVVETIRIEHDDFPDGVVINAEDFDAEKHVRFGEPKAQPEAVKPEKDNTLRLPTRER